uniref:Myosin light chain kinase 2, skeletal/cardiac muscle n=1 Tax=Apteryx owenii TaxID=8824 RepID=A0A8B9P1T4_APTOW
MERDGGPGSDQDEAQGRGKEKPAKEEALAAGEPEGRKAEPVEKAVAAKGPKAEKALAAAEAEGGKAEPTRETALSAAQAQDGGKEPAKEKAPAATEVQDGGKKAAKAEKAPATAKAQEGKEEPAKEKAPTAAKAQDGGKKAAQAEKAPATAKAQDGGKEEPAKAEKAPATAKAQDGEKEEPAKEKAPTAAKAQDGGKKAAKAEKAPATAKAQDGGKEEPAKEKAPTAAKAQDGGKEESAKAEKAPATAKAQDGGKEEPAKEKAPTAAKAQDGGKEEPAKAEKAPATAKAQDGGKEEPAKEKAPTAVKAQDGGKKAAKAEKEADKQKQPKGPKPTRPVLQQSLSCPASSCQRYPCAARPPRETTSQTAPAAEPGPAPTALGDLQAPEQSVLAAEPGPAPGSAGTQEERTLPEPAGTAGEPQPGLDASPAAAPASAPGAAEEPGPEAQGQLPSPEAEPPPSPYLTPDFGKEDPFEILDDVPPPPAPFAHRIVTLRSASVSAQFSLSTKEILGGGKFGEVHTCTEKQTGLKLAAKVIRKQGAKDKEMVLLEIDVMNQLNHRNLIQLYDAIETPREIILFMEFVEGGELFERIIDDDYHLTEVDCMVFVRQICEGIRFMHHMRVLHLDLKPENILCVAATGHMVKIIDFGLARRYNPQEKLKVNFGTPEFLSPEVVNYEQVTYATDMWSMGVITYMLLSGLSPFLGDNDTETLNNVLAANWYFDEETFESVSEEAKDFVSNLIIKEKSARMSAGQCLQHPWLNNLAEKAKRCNRRLKSQVLLKKYVMRRRWKKNFIGVCAANRFKKITSSGSLTALDV